MIQAFRMAAEPFFFNRSKEENAQKIYARVMKFFVIACCFMFLFIALYRDVLQWIITRKSRDWGDGMYIVPILAMGNIFLGIYYNLSIWYKLTNKNMYGAVITFSGAVITILLNILLIPKLHYLGAALATFCCYLFMLSSLEKSPNVIFTTAYDEYALKAFEVNALDYLLKPVEPKRLADAIQKLHFIETKEPASNGENVNKSLLTENDQVFVKDGERCWFVKLSDIRLFESVGNYAKVFFANNKPLILKSLNALEERLDEKMFFRANRKHIVNLRMALR